MRRHTALLPALVFVFLACPLVGYAMERTAFAFRGTDGMLVEILLPPSLSGPPGGVYFDFVGDVWSPEASTLDPFGRILSINSSDLGLVAYSPFSGQVEALCVFSQGLPPDFDLTFGPTGELLLALSTGQNTDLFVVDTEDCGLTAWGTFLQPSRTIEYHQGAFFSGGLGLYRIDPQTFQVTTIVPYHSWEDYWGLASDGANLWYLKSGSVIGGPTTTTIGAVDPETGDSLWTTDVPNQNYEEWFPILEVLEQHASVPNLSPAGLVALVFLVGTAGVLGIRRL